MGKKNRKKYARYIQSTKWETRRAAFRATRPPDEKGCARCGDYSRIHVHHLSYAKLGNEPDEDLCLLCKECHEMFHRDWHKRGGDLRKDTIAFIGTRVAGPIPPSSPPPSRMERMFSKARAHMAGLVKALEALERDEIMKLINEPKFGANRAKCHALMSGVTRETRQILRDGHLVTVYA